MGISNGNQIIFKLNNVVSRELNLIVDHITSKSTTDMNNSANNSNATNTNISNLKSIDCDVSNIIHKLSYRHNSMYCPALVRDTAIFLKNLAKDSGFLVVPVLDGDHRPQTKRDAFSRRYTSTMDQINAFYCRQSAMKLSAKTNRNEEDEQKLEEFKKEAKSLETNGRLYVPPSFKDDLEEALQQIDAYVIDRDSTGCVSRDTIKSAFEADYIMAYRMRNGLTSIIYSNDGDMLPLAGPNALCIRSFALEKKKKSSIANNNKRKADESNTSKRLYEYEITGGSNVLMEEIKQIIQQHSPSDTNPSKIKYQKAIYPILEEVAPLYLTALYMVGIGCDVLPRGVSTITPRLLMVELTKIKNEGTVSSDGDIYKRIVDLYIKKDNTKKLTKKDLLTYCQAFLYQPAVREEKKDDPTAWHYLNGPPTTLHPYLAMFRHPDSNISIELEIDDDVAEMKKCKGIKNINLPHSHLACEKSFTCSNCFKDFCGYCGYSPTKDRNGNKTKIYYEEQDNDICVDCFRENIFLPYSSSLDSILSVDEMKRTLREDSNQPLTTDIEPYEVQELYEMHLVEMSRKNDCDNVPFPVFTSSTLEMKDKKFGFGVLVDEFSIDNGAFFINSPNTIKNDKVASVINLIASIVSYGDNSLKTKTDIGYHLPVLDVVPDMLISFAEKARVNYGYRLLKRCLRHALDPKAIPLENTKAYLFESDKDGEIGLVLGNKVAASMKDAEYNSKIAFTASEVFATSCECHAGGCNKERVLCVHNLPLIYQFVMLLDDGFAEHFLIELCSRWDSELEDLVAVQGKTGEVRRNVLTLMKCANAEDKQVNDANAKLTIAEMLNVAYAMGTQRYKRVLKPPPVKMLRPLRDVDFSSLESKAKKRRMIARGECNESEGDEVNDDNQNHSINNHPPDYYEMYILITSLGWDIKDFDFPGWQLFMLRVQNTLDNKSKNIIDEYTRYKKRQWKDAINETYVRKVPYRKPNVRVARSTEDTTDSTTATLICQPVRGRRTRKKDWRRGVRHKCCFIKCSHTSDTDKKMRRIHPLPTKKMDLQRNDLRDVRTFLQKKMKRQYTLAACAQKDENNKEYFLCSHHEEHEITKSTTVKRGQGGRNSEGKTVNRVIKHTFTVPKAVGVRSSSQPTKRKSKGLGGERLYNRMINTMESDITTHMDDDTDGTENLKLLAEAASSNAKLAIDTFSEYDKLNEKCKHLEKENLEYKEKEKRGMISSQNIHHHNTNTNAKDRLPVISYDEMDQNDHEVWRRTGFRSLKHMLAFVAVICNGDIQIMTYKHTTLTWLEEWFFYFEYLWGRTIVRWVDAVATYNIHQTSLDNIFEKKLKMVKTCRNQWPRYASYVEDHTLAKQKWKDKFEGTRVVMWDDTNVNLAYKPSGADEQRLTYSAYYATNCAKGGVFVQLCGWMGVANLWVGATSDTHYQQQNKIFEQQDAFARNDLVDNQHIPFTNIFDKGYRVNAAAWRAGKQQVIQPTFARSDRKFSGRETIQTADRATTRSGNERGVNRSKLSGYIKRGVQQSAKTATMDDAWISWSFQTNFMYRSVH